MSGLNCTKCSQRFDRDSLLPLVLPCGDSACMSCLLQAKSQSLSLYKCPACSFIFEINNKFISELPKNKAILSIVSSSFPEYPNAGPQPKILFANTPEPKRIRASPDSKALAYHTPSSISTQLVFSSPNSVNLKCSRPGCNKDRYYYNGEVWDYCCMNCQKLGNAYY